MIWVDETLFYMETRPLLQIWCLAAQIANLMPGLMRSWCLGCSRTGSLPLLLLAFALLVFVAVRVRVATVRNRTHVHCYMEPVLTIILHLIQNERRDLKFRDFLLRNCIKILNVGRRIMEGLIHVATLTLSCGLCFPS